MAKDRRASEYVSLVNKLPYGIELTPEIAELIGGVEDSGFYWWADYVEHVGTKQRFYFVGVRFHPDRHTFATSQQPVFVDALRDVVDRLDPEGRLPEVNFVDKGTVDCPPDRDRVFSGDLVVVQSDE